MNTDNKTNRKGWLDCLRALAILFVIFGHFGMKDYEPFFIITSPIKLPLFFIISGYLFKPEYTENFKKFFFNKLRTLVVPYLCLSVIASLKDTASAIVATPSATLQCLWKLLKSILLGNTLWFIPCLIISEFFCFFVIKLLKKNCAAIGLVSLVFFAAGFIISQPNRVLPWHIDTSFITTAIMLIGYIIRCCEPALNKKRRIISSCVFFVIYAASVIAALLLGGMHRLDLNINVYPSLVFNALSMVAGPAALMIAAPLLPAPKFLVYIGRNTLTYYAVEGIAYGMLNTLAAHFMRSAAASSYMQIILTVLTCALLVIPSELLNRLLPFTVGKKKREFTLSCLQRFNPKPKAAN